MWNNWTVELSLERIANPSSKASPIDRRTSHRREEDDSLGDESPPLESTSQGDLEIAHVVLVQEKPSRLWTLHDDPPERSGFWCIADTSPPRRETLFSYFQLNF
ncbi:unnamed protein product [Spirodela intermedia]|uniref:Uncharacterized protein n=1 Tax=Spirodela intermedia TaxID=51605 RepID=A0A7I8LCK8_SPIIN|nr:unnamed protein product [Spirodela intermedia]